ncbi:hypothetical protein Cgig2_009147 [Carnegiea gigantea]|uniref:Uncharacterized protein n=1 Tax=Carnegiea gigantea TaxID=171969 RepID=A0A9Q1JPH3_9CARY|nr:hypothetical protein Cgig2_009147 [Carnegiea gigantea]
MYQKAFIMRMSTRSFSYVVAQLNEAHTEVVRSMGLASFLKVDLKQIRGKFSKWLKFPITAFDVYVTLGVPFGGREITEITKSSTDEEYDEINAAWLKEWKIEQNAAELTRMPEFILAKKDGGESFKRNFIIYLVNCFFSRLKNRYYNKSMKNVKDVSQIASLDQCQFILDKLITSARHYKENKANFQPQDKASNNDGAPLFNTTLHLHKPDSKDRILGTTLVTDTSVIVEEEDHHEDVVQDQPNNVMKKDDNIPSYSLGLGLSQPDNESLNPQTPLYLIQTLLGLMKMMVVKIMTTLNRELSRKKLDKNRSKDGDKHSFKKSNVMKHTIKIKN